MLIWPLVGWCSFCISDRGSDEEDEELERKLAEEAEAWFYGENGWEVSSCSGSRVSGGDGGGGSSRSSSSGYSSGYSSSSGSDGENEHDSLKW